MPVLVSSDLATYAVIKVAIAKHTAATKSKPASTFFFRSENTTARPNPTIATINTKIKTNAIFLHVGIFDFTSSM